MGYDARKPSHDELLARLPPACGSSRSQSNGPPPLASRAHLTSAPPEPNPHPDFTPDPTRPPSRSALGVFPSEDMSTEQSRPMLTLPASYRPGRKSADAPTRDSPSSAERSRDPPAAAQPASKSQEIWERKGWNTMDGGWKPFGLW